MAESAGLAAAGLAAALAASAAAVVVEVAAVEVVAEAAEVARARPEAGKDLGRHFLLRSSAEMTPEVLPWARYRSSDTVN